MRLRVTFILLALNLLAGLAIWRLEKKSREAVPPAGPGAIWGNTALPLHVDWLEISGSSVPEKRVLEKQGERWFLREPIAWPANPFTVEKVIALLQFLEPQIAFPLEEIKLAGHGIGDYGLEKPALSLSIGSGDRRLTVHFGSNTQAGRRQYLLDAYGKNIFVVSTELQEALLCPLEDLRSSRIFTFEPFEVQGLTVRSGNGTVTAMLNRQGEKWMIESPLRTTASPERVQGILAQLAGQEVTRFVPREELPAARQAMAEPFLQITLLAGSGKHQTLLVGGRVPPRPGGERVLESCRLGQLENSPAIFEFPAEIAEALQDACGLLRGRHLLSREAGSITGVDLMAGNPAQTLLLRPDEQGQWKISGGPGEDPLHGKPADQETVRAFLQGLEALEARSFLHDAPSTEDLERFGLAQPTITVLVHQGGKTSRLFLGNASKDGQQIHVRNDAMPTVCGVDTAFTELFSLQPLHWRQRTLWSLPANQPIRALRLYQLPEKKLLFERYLTGQSGNDLLEPIFLQDLPGERQAALLMLVAAARKFRVATCVAETLDNASFVESSGAVHPWKYAIEFELPAESAKSLPESPLRILLTERLGSRRQGGGIPALGLTFLLPQGMTDALEVFLREPVTAPFPAEGASRPAVP